MTHIREELKIKHDERGVSGHSTHGSGLQVQFEVRIPGLQKHRAARHVVENQLGSGVDKSDTCYCYSLFVLSRIVYNF